MGNNTSYPAGSNGERIRMRSKQAHRKYLARRRSESKNRGGEGQRDEKEKAAGAKNFGARDNSARENTREVGVRDSGTRGKKGGSGSERAGEAKWMEGKTKPSYSSLVWRVLVEVHSLKKNREPTDTTPGALP